MRNLLPDGMEAELLDTQNIMANDHQRCIYLGNLVRTVIALHNLIDNKVSEYIKNIFK